MFSRIFRYPTLLAFGPSVNTYYNYDKPAKGENYYMPKNDSESGWDRVKQMFRQEWVTGLVVQLIQLISFFLVILEGCLVN